ncbi:MAG: VWA domain-containing protein [Ktedonobacterales bacterium]
MAIMPTGDSYHDVWQWDEEASSSPITLQLLPERTLIRNGGSRRHVVCSLRVSDRLAAPRQSLTLGLILDRSGSMSGAPLQIAKAVAKRALAELTAEDQVAVLVFDNQFDVVQELARVTPELIRRIAETLDAIEARGSTALHEAWLRGCRLLASETLDWTRLAHTLLLTDGQANQGETDTLTIARQVADIRRQCAIGTSTFGLGDDYNQHLLGYMAMAGGGQFTHLRSTADLESSFLGVIGNLRATAARDVQLELETSPLVTSQVLSQYWYRRDDDDLPNRRIVDMGDLIADEQRRVVVHLQFPRLDDAPSAHLRARLIWRDAHGREQHSAWQQVNFSYASDAACDAEERDATVTRLIGLEYADRVQRQASLLSDEGDPQHAAKEIGQVIARITAYANGDAELAQAIEELRALAGGLKLREMEKSYSKDLYYRKQLSSRSQRDYRDGDNQ